MGVLLQQDITQIIDACSQEIFLKEKFPQTVCQQRFLEVTQNIAKESTKRQLKYLLAKDIGILSVKAESISDLPKGYRLVFVDGHYSTGLSHMPKDAIVLPLTEALKKYKSFLEHRLEQWAKEETSPWALLNGAAWIEGMFLYIPEGCVITEPVTVHFITTGSDSNEKLFISSPRMHVVLGRQTQLTLNMTSAVKVRAKDIVWRNSFLDCFLEDEASMQCYFSHAGVCRHSSVRSYIKAKSVFKVGILSGEACQDSHDIKCVLAGQGSHAEVIGLLGPKDSQHVDVEVLMRHQGIETSSQQKIRAILAGKAKASFQGKIFVEKEGDKTDAYQRIDSLLLDDGSEMLTQPELEIFADDVKASHGATVGKLEDENIFYMRSRGLDYQKAQRLLIYAFLEETAKNSIISTSDSKLCLKDFLLGIYDK